MLFFKHLISMLQAHDHKLLITIRKFFALIYVIGLILRSSEQQSIKFK